MSGRQWIVPDSGAYRRSMLEGSTSLLPGMSGAESVAAFSYAATLPMRRNRSIVDVWSALSDRERDLWVSRVRRDHGGQS